MESDCPDSAIRSVSSRQYVSFPFGVRNIVYVWFIQIETEHPKSVIWDWKSGIRNLATVEEGLRSIGSKCDQESIRPPCPPCPLVVSDLLAHRGHTDPGAHMQLISAKVLVGFRQISKPVTVPPTVKR